MNIEKRTLRFFQYQIIKKGVIGNFWLWSKNPVFGTIIISEKKVLQQNSLFPELEDNHNKIEARSGTFQDNMKPPLHKWFRYSAGYSAEWVKNVIRTNSIPANAVIFDPFSGSGTTLLAANECGYKAVGYEKHFFIRRIAEIKLHWHKIKPDLFSKKASQVIEHAKKNIKKSQLIDIPLLEKCYSKETLAKLESIKESCSKLKNENDKHIDDLIWLTLTSILRETSDAGTAQWQYVLPRKRKKSVKEPFLAFIDKVQNIKMDLENVQSKYPVNDSIVLDCDARISLDQYLDYFDLLITSPPYPNNYDYADSTRLELTFWREINGWGDLQLKIRKNLIHSCSQHTAAEKLNLDDILTNKALKPIVEEISNVCYQLAEIRHTKGGKKTYHTMIAAYYLDMAKTFMALRKMMKHDSTMCFVIGDSAPYGIYAPADRWLIKLALSAGFNSAYFEKIRDRNIKWKNRKHDVPLKEGRLWIKG